MLDNLEIVEEYMLQMKLANRSENTVTTYNRILVRFFQQVTVPVKEITSEHLFTWLETNGKDRKETTLSTWISVLSSFFTFCIEEEYIEQSPMKSRWRPRLPKPTPKYLEKSEVAKVRLQSEKVTLRDQTLFEFLLSSGCRITETCMLKKENLKLEERTARVIGKGNKIRTVHFSNRCAILLEKLLKILPEDVPYIFINCHGEPLSRVWGHKIVSEMGKAGEMKTSIWPHRLRHTFATTLLSKGAELSFISEELGHSDISTTRVYARLPQNELIKMYRQYMG